MRSPVKNLFVVLSLLSVHAFASDVDEVKKGLHLLYKDTVCANPAECLTEQNEKDLINQAIGFKGRLDALVKEAVAPKVTWTQTDRLTKSFEFDSLVQREPGHPSNKVKGFLFYPRVTSKCDIQVPATLLLHKLSDTTKPDHLESEKQIASLAATFDRGVVMLIYLPEYGERKSPTEGFITKSPEKFEQNILQALADVHQANLLLKSLPEVKKDDIGLMGLSLGAMVTLVSAGIDPIYDRYATNVGGGDLANIITYKKEGDVDSATAKVLKDIDWSVDHARLFLSRFDAITWSSNVKNKKITMINANSDELINKSLSVDKLLEGYKEAGSKTDLIMHKGTHVFSFKEVGIKDSIFKVILPMLNFIGKGSYCPVDTTYN